MKIFTFFFLLLFAACENEPTQSVRVSEETGKIVIQNNSSTPIYYAAFERKMLAYILWDAFCSDNNKIQPSKSSTISVAGLSDAPEEIVVFWWSECLQRPGSEILTGDNLQTVIVRMK